MPTERMEEVEVVCPCLHDGKHIQPATCRVCRSQDTEPPAIVSLPLAKGSLTSARLRLADAAEADEMARLKYEASGDGDAEWRAACGTRMAFLEAMNVVRALRTARGA